MIVRSMRTIVNNTLLSQIEFREDNMSFLDELRKADIPVLLYGGGSYARDVLNYLKINDIRVDMIFADAVLQDILDDYQLKRIDIKDIDFPCVVIMGFAKYMMGKELAEKNTNIKKVYYPVLMPYDEIDGFDRNKFMERLDDYQNAYEILADDFSRKCMAAYLNSRLNKDATYCFSCYEGEQSYFDNSVFKAGASDNYLDIGAYTGDTIRLFTKEVGGSPMGHIWAVEADKSFMKDIVESIEESGVKDITEVFYTGLWSERKTICFKRPDYSIEEGYFTENESGCAGVDVDTLDNLLHKRTDKVSFLKINFRDADKIVEGGKKLIEVDKPKLAIVVAFGTEMITKIPKLIKSINPDYKVYLRFNSPMTAKLVCYAFCE